jgi:hypothetical protein
MCMDGDGDIIDASFRVADQRGWQPSAQEIVVGAPPFLTTTLPVDRVYDINPLYPCKCLFFIDCYYYCCYSWYRDCVLFHQS